MLLFISLLNFLIHHSSKFIQSMHKQRYTEAEKQAIKKESTCKRMMLKYIRRIILVHLNLHNPNKFGGFRVCLVSLVLLISNDKTSQMPKLARR